MSNVRLALWVSQMFLQMMPNSATVEAR